MAEIYVIAEPNGAGKTTAAFSLLPENINCHEFVNADSIAASLSPFNPDAVAITAGRIMLERIHYLAEQNVTFAFETTLASKSFLPFLQKCKKQGYKINLVYFWLPLVELAKARVLERVIQGGHDIPSDVIARKYRRSLENLFNIYLPIIDSWIFYDNSTRVPTLIADGTKDEVGVLYDKEIWQQLSKEYGQK